SVAPVALGQGADTGGAETAPPDSPRAAAVARQGRGVSAPHTEYFLPTDAGGLGADAAGDDRALLYGRASDGVPRPAAHHGVVLVHLGVLHRGIPRTVSQALEALGVSAAHADGGGRGADDHQHARCYGSAVWYSHCICPHTEIRHRRPGSRFVHGFGACLSTSLLFTDLASDKIVRCNPTSRR